MAPALVVHFHPGWAHGSGTVLESLLADGAYRSQWTTGTSNGGLTAHRGGQRWEWESRLFAGRYDDADPGARPVYGAWNRRDDPYGAAPRFGSAHLRLRADVVERATFCWPDSVFSPTAVGGPELLDELCRRADTAVGGDPAGDPLDDYVEAHVHGPLRLDADVDAVVLDPSDLAARPDLVEQVDAAGPAVETHPGFSATVDDLDPGYRGEVPLALARELGGVLTPARLAAARRTGAHDPQAVKWLWHCLARFGRAPA